MTTAPPDWRQRLAAAMQHHQAGRFSEAISLYHSLVNERPEEADALHLLGLALTQSGNPAQGKPIVELAVRQAPDVAGYHVTLGHACRALGQSDEAASAYNAALTLQRASIEALSGLAELALDRSDWAVARDYLQQALTAHPNSAELRFNLARTDLLAGADGDALPALRSLLTEAPAYAAQIVLLIKQMLDRQDAGRAGQLLDLLAPFTQFTSHLALLRGSAAALRGDHEQAIAEFQAVLAQHPDNIDALRHLSQQFLQREAFDKAIPLLERAQALAPQDFAIFTSLGIAQARSGAFDRAAPILQQVVAHDPGNLLAWASLATALAGLFQYEAACDALRKLIALDPAQPVNYVNLAGYESILGHFEAAEAACSTALAYDARSALARGALANLRGLQGRADEAEALYRELLAEQPDDATTATNLGLLLLRQGRYAEGWPFFAARMRGKGWSSADGSRGLPRWDGRIPSNKDGGRVLIWREQGIGDEILYAGVLPDIVARGADILLAADPRLVPLFARSFPAIHVVADGSSLDPATLGATSQLPMADAAALMRRQPADFTTHPPAYLKADAQRAALLRQRYTAGGNTLVIGVAWSSHNPRVGRNKSLTLADMIPLLQQRDAAYVSLQYGAATADPARLKAETGITVIQDPEIDPLADVDGQAAQIAACDMVLTVSTAAAHLAAALGIPTLVLLRQDWGQLWYWGDRGEATPWYPSARICRASLGASAAQLVEQAGPVMQAMLTALRRG